MRFSLLFLQDAGLIGVGAVALLVSSLSNAAAPTILRAVIDGSSKGSAGGSGSGSGGSGALLASERAMLLKALGVFTVGALGSWLRTKSLGCVSARVGRRLRRQLFAALLKKPAAFFDFKAEQGGLSSADADTRLGRDVDTCTKVCLAFDFMGSFEIQSLFVLGVCLMPASRDSQKLLEVFIPTFHLFLRRSHRTWAMCCGTARACAAAPSWSLAWAACERT